MPPFMTAEEFYRLPPDNLYDSFRDELIRGVHCVREPPPGGPHGEADAMLVYLLVSFVLPRRLGRIRQNAGFVFERNPDTVCAPDISFMAAHRAADFDKPYPDGAPELAVEILSPGNTKKDTAWHVDLYLRTGSRLVWIVDPKRHTVTVHRPTGGSEMLSAADRLSGDDVLPGFECTVADLFY